MDPIRANSLLASTTGGYSFVAAQRAYGVTPTARANTAGQVATQALAPSQGATKVDAVRSAPVEGASRARAADGIDAIATRLVGAVVPGRVDFSGPTPTQARAEGSLPFYRNPADRNTAATQIALGRGVDVTG